MLATWKVVKGTGDEVSALAGADRQAAPALGGGASSDPPGKACSGAPAARPAREGAPAGGGGKVLPPLPCRLPSAVRCTTEEVDPAEANSGLALLALLQVG